MFRLTESIVEPCLTELLERRGVTNDGALPRCDGFAAHLRVRSAGCITRLDCKAAGTLELPLHCAVFGYFRKNESTGSMQFRLLSPVRGYVEAKDLFRFEVSQQAACGRVLKSKCLIVTCLVVVGCRWLEKQRVAKPADISSSPVASVLTSLPSGTARASVIHVFATHRPTDADNPPNFAASPMSEATTAATTTAEPRFTVHTILDTFNAAWTQFLSGLPPLQLGGAADSEASDDAALSPFVPAILTGDSCERKTQQNPRAVELWDLLRRRYKVAALRIMRVRIEEQRSRVQQVRSWKLECGVGVRDHSLAFCPQAAEAYDRRRNNIVEARLCKICWDAEIDITCVPCGHQCVCHDCAQDIRQCPMCCSVIDDNRPTGFPPSYGQDTVLLSRQPPLCGRHEPGAVRRVVSAATTLLHDFASGCETTAPSNLRLFYSPTNIVEQQLEDAQDMLLTLEPSVLLPSLSSSPAEEK